MKDGKPVPFVATVEVNFQLRGDPGHLTAAKFGVPAGASRPMVLHVRFPAAGVPTMAKMTVRFDVDESGAVKGARATEEASSQWARDMVSATGRLEIYSSDERRFAGARAG